MINSVNLFELAQLAEASYANLILGNDLETELQNPVFKMQFSATQAAEFAKNWAVVNHQPNAASGYSGTVFKYIGNDPNSGFTNGQLVFAQRGTEPGFLDLVQADFNELVVNGLAYRQIIDMYNYWQQLSHPAGAIISQAHLVAAGPNTPSDKIITDASLQSTAYFTIELENVSNTSNLSQPISLSDLAGITGHSLGGHLSDAFTRLFGGEATTINGAGFPTGLLPGLGLTATQNIQNVFSMLGGAANFPSANISNIYGDKMWEFVTMDRYLGMVQQGSHDALFIEDPALIDDLAGHGSSLVTNSLAVVNLFIKLDASLASKAPGEALAQLNALFEKSSNHVEQSLEKLVEGLTEIIFGFKPNIIIDNRESLYSAINNMTVVGAEIFNNLVGQVQIVSPPTSITEARSDFGAFLSLVNLTPFAPKNYPYNDGYCVQDPMPENPDNLKYYLEH